MSGLSSRVLAASMGLAGALAISNAASAATVFSEDFSGATPNEYNAGAIPGTKFTVAANSQVDILGVLNGSFYTCAANPSGNCMDTVGQNGAGSTVTSSAFALTAGTTYTLSFADVLQGFSASDPQTGTYNAVVDGFTHLFTSTGAVKQQSFSFTPLTSVSNATLAFTVLTAPDTVHGPVLSSILITGADPAGGGGPVSGAPEPSTWVMMIAGCGLVGTSLRSRRRSRTAATA